MAKRSIYIILIFCALVAAKGCIDPYEPSFIGEDHSFLVVEGLAHSSEGTSYIRLSRTARLADSASIMPELNAVVQLEGKDQSPQQLSGTGDGRYTIGHLNFQPGVDYRLRILTANGSEYLSDFVTVKNTPPIDSLSWSREAQGVQVYVNTHDPENATTYYRWDYEETWEFDADYYSSLEFVDEEVVSRDPDENVYTCWQSNRSGSILLGSSARLSEDIIHLQPLAFVPANSWKMSKKYSILVRQYALSREAFEYFQQMKKNSELGASIFAPQPTELRGNIYCLNNPDEPVIGYFGANTLQEKRIYIENNELPGWFYASGCELIQLSADSAGYYFGERGYAPVLFEREAQIYYASEIACVDCTLKGKSEKPDFWE